MIKFLSGILSPTFVRFFFSSLTGVIVDLAIFSLLTSMKISPGIASVISSISAVACTYALSTKFVFHSSFSLIRLIFYFAWYATSISFFAWAIELAWENLGGLETYWKIVSLPLSLVTNFLVVKFVIFRQR